MDYFLLPRIGLILMNYGNKLPVLTLFGEALIRAKEGDIILQDIGDKVRVGSGEGGSTY